MYLLINNLCANTQRITPPSCTQNPFFKVPEGYNCLPLFMQKSSSISFSLPCQHWDI